MLMGIALLLRTVRLLVAGFCVGAGGIGIGGAEGIGAGFSLALQQSLQRQMPTAKVQMAALIMADREVKVQWGSGVSR